MRRPGKLPSPLLVGVVGLLSTAPSTAPADVFSIETGYVSATSSVVELPRSYIVPSSYVGASSRIVPSSYRTTVYELSPTSVILPSAYTSLATTTYVPTTYVPTTTYLPTTAYVPTGSYYYPTRAAYRRAMRYRGRSYVSYEPMALTPTYYVSPTTVVATSAYPSTAMICCDSPSTPAVSYPAALPRSSGTTTERTPGAFLDSKVAGEPSLDADGGRKARDQDVNAAGGTPSNVGTPPARESYKAPANPGGTPTTEPTAKPADPKPVKEIPLAPSKPRDTPSPPPRQDPDPVLPAVPPFPEPPKEDAVRRDSYKPTSSLRPALLKNILQGRVVSADSKLAEEDVEVVVTDRTGRYLDRTTRTNAYGQFAISLPEGDWTIKVTMPSGRALAVSEGTVTATSGRVLDKYGRDLKDNLVIQR